MNLVDYKKWLVEQIRLKIKAGKIIESWNPKKPILVAKNKGFIEALEVMVAFIEQVTPETLRIHPKEKKTK